MTSVHIAHVHCEWGERNGTEQNGTERNGMEWNETEWNGTEWNGTGWNRTEWNGMERNETKRNERPEHDVACPMLHSRVSQILYAILQLNALVHEYICTLFYFFVFFLKFNFNSHNRYI